MRRNVLTNYVDNARGLSVVVPTLIAIFAYVSPAGAMRSKMQTPPHVTIRATTATAFESSTNEGVFLISRDGSTAQPLTVRLTIGGSATNGIDYTTIPAEVQIPAGAATTEVRVKPIDDSVAESDEVVSIGLADVPVNTVSGNTLSLVTIKDNDTIVEISATDANGSEAGPHPISFRVARNGNVRSQLTVNYFVNIREAASRTAAITPAFGDGSVRIVQDGTSNTISIGEESNAIPATSGVDFAPLPGTITLQPGETSKVITVTPIDDSIAEPTESVTLVLERSQLYTVGPNGVATGVIRDNDQTLPSVSISATQPNANEEGPVNGVISITRAGNTLQPLTVFYSINASGINVPNPATNGLDFESLSGQVVVPAGSSSVTIQIKPVDDNEHEPEERVALQLVASQSYTIQPGSAQAIVKIKDHHRP